MLLDFLTAAGTVVAWIVLIPCSVVAGMLLFAVVSDLFGLDEWRWRRD